MPMYVFYFEEGTVRHPGEDAVDALVQVLRETDIAVPGAVWTKLGFLKNVLVEHKAD